MTTVSPQGRAVSLNLDELARPIRFEAPETEAWTAKYQATGELEEIQIGSGVSARKTAFAYDDFHRLETIEDPEQRVVTFSYDDANRVTSTLLPDGKAVGFGYDPNGNVTAVTPPGRPAHVFSYTARNQLETYTLPDAGDGPAVESRVYDDSKRLKEVHRPDGKVISFDYEQSKDRLEKITSPRGETKFSYNSTNGLVAEIEEPDGQKVAFEYEGTLLKRTTWTGEVNGSVGRTYDNNFRVKTVDVNGEDPIEYVYDDDNQLIQVGEMTITRDPETGREVSTQLGNVTTLRTYTAFGEPESYTVKFGETEIYYEHLSYNKLGWVTDIERRQNGFHELLHYEYDERGRLEEVWRDGSLESSYTHDDNSNRLSYTGPLGNAAGTYDARDRVLTYGDATYTWTDAGELLSKTEGSGTTTYDYDVFGNLRKVELPNGIVIEYLTDGLQRRIGKKVNGVLVKQWLYQDQLEPALEYDLDGSVTRFVSATNVHYPDYQLKSTATERYIADYLGSTRIIVDVQTGVITAQARFDVYGRILLNSNPVALKFGFAGALFDHDVRIDRLDIRDYDSDLGRWTSQDPSGLSADESNGYLYCAGSPASFVDPYGREKGDLVFFSRKPGSDWPYHVGFDTGNDQIMMLTNGKIKSVDLNAYACTNGYGIVGYGELTGFVAPDEFIKNLTAVIPTLEGNFQNWDSSGTVCIDIVAAGLGQAYPALQKAIRTDYNNNPGAYSTPITDNYFWRKNSTLTTYFKNSGLFEAN